MVELPKHKAGLTTWGNSYRNKGGRRSSCSWLDRAEPVLVLAPVLLCPVLPVLLVQQVCVGVVLSYPHFPSSLEAVEAAC